MNISKGVLKKIESIDIENDKIKVTILPELGGKFASIYSKETNFELLFQNKDEEYRIPELGDDFAAYDASGFDDAFPNIDPERKVVEGRKIHYPDHGEIWTKKFDYKICGDELRLVCVGKVFNHKYEKTINVNGNDIGIKYMITNKDEISVPCFWTMHCLVNCMDDMIVEFPKGTDKVVNVQDSAFLGEAGNIHRYPRSEEGFELNKVLPASAMDTEKYYCVGKVENGECGIIYPSANTKFGVEFDPDELPYLGFWVTSGGFRGDYNCALEPSNGYYDSVSCAEKNNAIPVLKPGESMRIGIRISLTKYNENGR